MDRNLGNENVAVDRFEEAIKCLESLKLDADETVVEQRVTKQYLSHCFPSFFLNYVLIYLLSFFSVNQYWTSYTTN